MEVSDHSPLIISISTDIPKAHIFRFENFWLLKNDFQALLNENWSASPHLTDKARIITSKFKNLRGALKVWSSRLSNIKTSIANISTTLQFLETLEGYRDLSLQELNFICILRGKLLALLEQQRIYWKQRGAVKWATLGDAGTKFFHANATIRHRRNMIASLKTDSEDTVTSHSDKEQLLWDFSKQIIGQSDFKGILFDLPSLIQTHEGLE